jgi:hypothetical protein
MSTVRQWLAGGVMWLSAWPLLAAPSTMVGTWQGTLKAGGIELRLVVYVSQTADGFAAKFDSPDQGAKDLPFDSATVADGTLTLTAKAGSAVYTGKLTEDGTQLKGTWKQAGQSFPLDLRRDDRVVALKRPQTPKAPFPYRSTDVTFPSVAKDVRLAGTLTLPTGTGPFPAVILISGSGPQDRDETLFEHKPFAVLADHLTRQGFAVLRYDDRGVGQSTGQFSTARTPDFADDARGAVQFLGQHEHIDGKKIGLIGHSEGGLIAPLVATQTDAVAFLVLLAGPGLPGHEVLFTQMQAVAKASGTPSSAANTAAQRKLLDLAISDLSDAELPAALRKVVQSAINDLSPEEKKAAGPAALKDAEENARALAAPWMRWFLRHDPRPVLQKVRVPVLALNGGTDVQVDATANLAAIATALKAGNHARSRTVHLPGLNHLFQTSPTGAVSDYGKIEETLAPALLTTLTDWLRERMRD